jgi:Ca-activated chloride channel family protein
VSYQRPNQRTGHDIGLTVDIDAGVSIESIACPTHAIDVQRTTGNKARVKLASRHEIPNKDFVLRYTVAGDAVKCALLTTRSQGTGYFTLMLVPPRNLERLERGPVEMVFVLDRSGSMNGKPIEQARAAIERGIRHMRPDDTFQIIDFAENVSKLGNRPISATDRNIREGLSYLSTLDASGGTYMLPGMKAALRFPHDDERLRVVAFLTDGFIGNEAENLTELDASLGHSRVFGFGVGSAPNRWLMNEMSAMGRGAVAYVGLDEPAADVMDDFFDRISHAALSDLNIDWGAAKVTDVYPSRLPDLFVGRPVIITGKFSGEFTSDIRIKGRAGGKATTVRIDPTDSNQIAEAQAALPKVWARMKITDLSRSALRRNPAECNATIRQTAIEYGLMSNFTAFVAVDSLEKTAGGYGTTVQVPVPIPEGTRYETAVSEGRERARVR